MPYYAKGYINVLIFQVLAEQKTQALKTRGLEYGISGLRPPRRFKIEWCSDLQYQNPPKDPIALASFPGSGNTWLRYLLQQATGKSIIKTPVFPFLCAHRITFFD